MESAFTLMLEEEYPYVSDDRRFIAFKNLGAVFAK